MGGIAYCSQANGWPLPGAGFSFVMSIYEDAMLPLLPRSHNVLRFFIHIFYIMLSWPRSFSPTVDRVQSLCSGLERRRCVQVWREDVRGMSHFGVTVYFKLCSRPMPRQSPVGENSKYSVESNLLAFHLNILKNLDD
jgi:hypothetical protein